MPSPLDRPSLRPGLAAARDENDPFAVILFDQLRISRQFLRLTPREFTWLQWLDGTNSLRDLQATAMRNGGGELLPIDVLTALVDRLDAALFLDSPRFAERLAGPVREPACLGCYAADPEQLRVQLDGYFTAPGGPGLPSGEWGAGSGEKRRSSPLPTPHAPLSTPHSSLRALLAPHIDYARGGVTYAWTYKELAERCAASLFVIVATSHYSPARFTLTRQDFKTPLGVVPTDQQYVDRIVGQYGEGLFDDPIAHLPEHSIELEVVFLQHLFGRHRPIRIVPLLVGSFADCVESGTDPAGMKDIARMVEALRRAEAECPEPVVYVISGDLAHIGPKFGDDGPLKPEFLAESRSRDQAILERAVAADPAGLFRVIAVERDVRRICGLPPAWTVLQAIRPNRGRVLRYDQYVHPRGAESVSFAGVAFYA